MKRAVCRSVMKQQFMEVCFNDVNHVKPWGFVSAADFPFSFCAQPRSERMWKSSPKSQPTRLLRSLEHTVSLAQHRTRYLC